MPRKKEFSKGETNRIIKLFNNESLSSREIGKIMECSKFTIGRILLENGCDIRCLLKKCRDCNKPFKKTFICASNQKFCKDCLKIRDKENERRYRIKHSKQRREYNKIYEKEHRKERNEYNKRWQKLNRHKIAPRQLEYKKKNKEKYRIFSREYNMKKWNVDLDFTVPRRLRSLCRKALREYFNTGRITSSKKYGIDYKAIIKHLKPFPKDISKYHIDHIRPLCSFQFVNADGSTNSEEIKKAFAPENHQWLTAEENLKKGSKY